MKKGDIVNVVIKEVEFPNKGIGFTEEGEKVTVKNTIPGQKLSIMINKKRGGRLAGRVLEVIESSADEIESPCPHFGICGGCVYQSLPYEKQLFIKENQIKKLLEPVIGEGFEAMFEGIKGSPECSEYRNKMEFSFGDEVKDGPLTLGMHKRGSFYDVVEVPECQIIDADMRKVLTETLSYFKENGISYYKKMQHVGYLRHLLVRKTKATGEILVDLITTTQVEGFDEKALIEGWKDRLLGLNFTGEMAGILHTKNDSLSDAVIDEGTEVLFGRDYITENLLGLDFKITPFSFFQTNSRGAEVLYSTARDFISDAAKGAEVFDLYSGTGTIAQVLAPAAKHVTGVEIIEEAVEAAKENAALNGLSNCDFLAGDVLKVLDDIEEKPDFIVLDPPRDGIHPKAITKIIDYGVESMIYISCKPTSLARDLEIFMEAGYMPKRVACVDMFPATGHVETVVLLSRSSSDDESN